MIFHENRLLADDSYEISYLIFFRKLGKMVQNLSTAAVVIGALRVKLRKDGRPIQIAHEGAVWSGPSENIAEIKHPITQTFCGKQLVK